MNGALAVNGVGTGNFGAARKVAAAEKIVSDKPPEHEVIVISSDDESEEETAARRKAKERFSRKNVKKTFSSILTARSKVFYFSLVLIQKCQEDF